MFCNNCGRLIADGIGVCPHCGAPQNAQQPAYQQPQQPMYQQPQQPQQPAYQQPQQPAYQQPQQPAYQQPQQPAYQQPQQPAYQQPQQPAYQQPQQPAYQQPQQPAYQQPQQPAYQQPQQPAYQQPQQPAYQQPQQPAYQQPAYQQPAYQQPQAPKEVLDFIPSENSSKIMPFIMIGFLGLILIVVATFLDPLKKAHYWVSVAGQLCSGIGLFFVYDSFKKGLKARNDLFAGICGLASLCCLGYYLLMFLAEFLIVLSSKFPMNLAEALGGGICAIFALLFGIAFLGCAVLVGLKMLAKYEGKLKLCGIMLMVVPAVIILSAIAYMSADAKTLVDKNTFAIICAFFNIGACGYLYYLAIEVIAGKKLSNMF